MSGIDLAGGLYGLYGDIMAVTMGTDLTGFGLGAVEDDEAAMYSYLVRTRDVILKAPHMFKVMKNPLEVACMLDYAIRYWDTPQIDHVLGILENEEQRLLKEGVIVYPQADLSGAELGELGKGFFKKVANAVGKGAKAVVKATVVAPTKLAAKVTKKVVKATVVAPTKLAIKATKAVAKGTVKAAKAVGKGVVKAAKATGKAVAKAAKAVGKFVLKFNPVSLAARGGMLMAIRVNLFKLADKLQYGLYTDEQAQAAGLNMDDFHSNQEAYQKSKNLWCKTLKGDESKFRSAIEKGVKHRAINGLLDEMSAMSESELGTLDALFKRKAKAGKAGKAGKSERASGIAIPATEMSGFGFGELDFGELDFAKISRIRERFRRKNRTGEPVSENMVAELEGLGFVPLIAAGVATAAIIKKRRKNKKSKSKLLGELGALGDPATMAMVTAALSFITAILKFFTGKKNPKTGEGYPEENPTEDKIDKNWFLDALETGTEAINKLLPGGGGGDGGGGNGGGGGGQETDMEEFDGGGGGGAPVQPQSSSKISDFIKNNKAIVGVGALALAAGVYFLTRKKKK
jgi:hypothetical protein